MILILNAIIEANIGVDWRCSGVKIFIRYVESLVIHTIYFNKTGEKIQRGS